MRLLTLFTTMFISLALGSSSAWSTVSQVQLSGERLTVKAENVPLTHILKKLTEQGVRVRIDPQINPEISATITDRPVGAALKNILKSLDYALIWQEEEAQNNPRLQEIRIFRPGQEEQMEDLRRQTNLEIVENGDGTYHVKNVLLLQLTEEMTKEELQALLEQIGGTVIHTHLPLGLVKVYLPEGVDIRDLANTLSQYPGIKNAEPDFAYPVKGNKQIIGSTFQEVLAEQNHGSTNSTVVAVVDSGLQSDYLESPFVAGSYDAVSPEAQQSDALGHGTQMTLLAAGAISPNGVDASENNSSQVLAIRGIDDNGYTSNYTLISGIDYAIEMGAQVMSLSWGSSSPSSMLESATEYALANGIVLVAAAGNEPTGTPVYPAAYESVIGVGALTESGEPWLQSNYGDFVDLQAPGMAEMPVGFKGDPGTYVGTSIATAYTARRIAEILQDNPEADLATILNTLKEENDIQ